jgi:PAS domain S-box-containing protein
MKDAHPAIAPKGDGLFDVGGRPRFEEALAPSASEGLVIGLGLRVAELRQMNLELRDALGALHDRYEVGADRYEFAPIACCGLDAAGTITDINVAGAVLFGSSSAAIVGRPLTAFVAPDDRGAVAEHVRSCGALGVRTRTAVTVLGAGGAPTAAQIISAPLRGDAGDLTLVTAIVDAPPPAA